MEQRFSAAALMSAMTADLKTVPGREMVVRWEKAFGIWGIYILVTFAQSITFQNQLFSTLHDL